MPDGAQLTQEERYALSARVSARMAPYLSEFARDPDGYDELHDKIVAEETASLLRARAKVERTRPVLRCAKVDQKKFDNTLPMWTVMARYPWTPTERRVLAVLRIAAGKAREIQICVAEIAARAKCSQRAVQLSTPKLRAAGLIAYEERRLTRARSEVNTYELADVLYVAAAGPAAEPAPAEPIDRVQKPAPLRGEFHSPPDQDQSDAGKPGDLGAVSGRRARPPGRSARAERANAGPTDARAAPGDPNAPPDPEFLATLPRRVEGAVAHGREKT